jgi:hypothetical protein
MTPTIEASQPLVFVFWLAMFPIAVFVLYLVTGYFTGEPPSSLRKAALTVLFVAGAVFLAFDAAGYLFARMMQDPDVGIIFPPGFGYTDWLKEPLSLKWQVLGFVPFIRFLPIIFALCVGGVLFVALWSVPFRVAAVLFIAQLFLDLVAMAVLSWVLRLGLNFTGQPAGPPPGPGQVEAPTDPALPPQSLPHLRQRVQDLGPDKGPWWRRAEADWESFNQHLGPLYDVLRPVTQHLPQPAQDFLNSGGWPLILVGLVLLGAFWPRIHRKRKHHRHRHRPHPVAALPRDRLSLIGDAFTSLGPRQATVLGVPARLRLVVLAPTEPEAGPVPAAASVGLLDTILPGLGEVAGYDVPRIEAWGPLPHSFEQAVKEGVEFPEPGGAPSRWVVVLGTAPAGQTTLAVALALYANETMASRMLQTPDGKWARVLGLRDVPADERL